MPCTKKRYKSDSITDNVRANQDSHALNAVVHVLQNDADAVLVVFVHGNEVNNVEVFDERRDGTVEPVLLRCRLRVEHLEHIPSNKSEFFVTDNMILVTSYVANFTSNDTLSVYHSTLFSLSLSSSSSSSSSSPSSSFSPLLFTHLHNGLQCNVNAEPNQVSRILTYRGSGSRKLSSSLWRRFSATRSIFVMTLMWGISRLIIADNAARTPEKYFAGSSRNCESSK